jgi:5-methyltetrahydrofolate--homocysteine methyltransferase
MSQQILESLANSLVDLDLDSAKRGVQQALEASISPQDIIGNGLARGMELVGKRFEDGEYFLAELISAGAIMEETVALLKPHLEAGAVTSSGVVVVGTVQGDLHDVGKNILVSMLKSAGFKVVDLGVDVPPERFVEKAKETKADIVCLSALLSVVVPKLEETVKLLRQEVPSARIMVGGRCIDEKIAQRIGAVYAKDAWAGAKSSIDLMKLE